MRTCLAHTLTLARYDLFSSQRSPGSIYQRRPPNLTLRCSDSGLVQDYIQTANFSELSLAAPSRYPFGSSPGLIRYTTKRPLTVWSTDMHLPLGNLLRKMEGCNKCDSLFRVDIACGYVPHWLTPKYLRRGRQQRSLHLLTYHDDQPSVRREPVF